MIPVTANHQQREQGAGHFLADFRGKPADSFLVCLLMRTRRGVSLVQAVFPLAPDQTELMNASRGHEFTRAVRRTALLRQASGVRFLEILA
jgi:hypothetical protein